ncbi:MAG: 16S rRNA (cytosine(1402)-N(4))-methyltransferase RsmH [Prolixibacteraceae bacterium]|jgi:16S rRNA (cytosine1402-N4)-methyltransferase|nr:16S rRNA (cytosine(1402)-N(4))-methyltransferase RsmH [Prolixibacteraceae bacterium]
MSEYHIPVLLKESIDGLNLQPNGIYVDVTYGGGGHSRLILERLRGGKLVAFDQDEDALQNLIDDERLIFVNHNFKFIKNFLRFHGIPKVDGILADLGVSSHDFDQADRGFSFRFDGKLDMRMNQSAETDAVKVINEYEVQKLGVMFREYGEIQNWRNLSETISQARTIEKIVTVTQFLNIISRCVPAKVEKKYLAQVFQALRIEVNGEMQALETFLESTLELMNPGGRLVVISYHSLEDRMVKNFMRSGRIDGKSEQDFFGHYHLPLELITRKVIVPGEEETQRNPRARSARLRIAQRTA